jgi:hypothetical protein
MTLYAPPNLEAGTEAQYDILNLVKGTAHRVGRSKLKESSAYQD